MSFMFNVITHGQISAVQYTYLDLVKIRPVLTSSESN